MAKSRRGLDKRHCDNSGQIERKHGNTSVPGLGRMDNLLKVRI